MSWTSTTVTKRETEWTVTAESTSGESVELAYATEQQARYFAAVLALRPASLPQQAIRRPASPRGASIARALATLPPARR